MIPEFPASLYQGLVGKTVASVAQLPEADEGLRVAFTDGSRIEIGFSGCEGTIAMYAVKVTLECTCGQRTECDPGDCPRNS